MSLFKIFKGTKNELDQVKENHDGYAYYLTDKSNLFIDAEGTRKKVVGLSQVNRQFTLSQDNNYTAVDGSYTDFFKANGYTYIVSPDVSSYDIYSEAGLKANDPTDGSMVFTYKEKPSTSVTVNILRVEEDPYYG